RTATVADEKDLAIPIPQRDDGLGDGADAVVERQRLAAAVRDLNPFQQTGKGLEIGACAGQVRAHDRPFAPAPWSRVKDIRTIPSSPRQSKRNSTPAPRASTRCCRPSSGHPARRKPSVSSRGRG